MDVLVGDYVYDGWSVKQDSQITNSIASHGVSLQTAISQFTTQDFGGICHKCRGNEGLPDTIGEFELGV
jgi:hypothetical protein